MNFRQLNLLRAMIRLGSVSETARALHISQPAVSKTLSGIEADLDMKLFHRANGRLSATLQARLLLPELERIVGDIATLHAIARTMRDGKAGFVSVAATPTLARTLVATAIGRFRSHHPDVGFSVTAGSTHETIDRIASNQAEIGFAQPSSGDVAVQTSELCRGSVVCMLPASHRLAGLAVIGPQDLRGCDLIGFSPGTPTGGRVADAFRSAGVGYQIAIETNQTVVAGALVASGQGIALVDSFLDADAFPHLVLRPFRPEIVIRVMTVTSNRRPLSPLAAAFCEEITALAEAEFKS